MKKYTIALALFLVFGIYGFAQDLHFTQYYATPMTLNPALTGALSGKYRFAFQYRDQWRRALDSPMSSFSSALDLRFPLGYSNTFSDAFGAGIHFQTDRVADIGFSTTQMGMFGAFHKSLNEKNNQFFSAGLRIAFGQRNINYQNLFFGDQFNGSSGYTNATLEELPANNFSFSDFSVGVSYTYTPRRKTSVFMGAAIHHFNSPQIGYYYDEELDEQISTSPLYQKLTGHINVQIPITSKVRLTPRVAAHAQGPHLEINAGSNIRLALGEYGASALHLGGWVRPVTNTNDGFDLATAIAIVGFEIDNFLFGLSYDLALSEIQTSPSGQTVFELSVAYLGDYQSETILCPKF